MSVSRFKAWRLLRDGRRRDLLLAPDHSGRYYRRLLIGGAGVISIAILLATLAGVLMLIQQFMDEQRHIFMDQRGFVEARLQRYQESLKQTAEAYEMHWSANEHDHIPVERYRQLLNDNGGVVPSGRDLTATSSTILSTLDHREDDPRLSTLLGIMSQIARLPLLHQLENGYPPEGFVYSPERNFLATWPALAASKLDAIRAQGVNAYVDSAVDEVEMAMGAIPLEVLREQSVVWVSEHLSPITGESATFYAVPIYQGDLRVAVMVVTIPLKKLALLLQDTNHEPGFFVLSQEQQYLLGTDDLSDREGQWAQLIREKSTPVQQDSRRPEIRRIGGTFFLSQYIPGPNWVAVYAFDWHSFMSALNHSLLMILIPTILVLGVLWVFIFLLDRFVLSPLRVQARQLYESEAFNRAMLATAPVGLAVYDPSTDSIVMQNEVTQQLLASSSEGPGLYRRLLKGRTWIRPNHPGASESNEVSVAETSVTDASGQRREISAAFSMARYQQREVVLFGLTDISDQKSAVRLLQRARESSDQANQAKSMFLAMMSHEIRTPLHGALGNLELLEMDQLAPRHKERVSTIRRAFDTLLVLINDILDLSKMEAQELHLHTESFHLVELVEHCAQTFTPVILGKQLRFMCVVDPCLAGQWSGDGHRITQVLMNLLGNARKFTETGSITLRAMRGVTEGGVTWVRLSVSDTGIGIAQARMEHVFKPFMQADNSIARRFGGSGLGLTLCQRIVELMGGNIAVDSEEQEGSIFTVNLPLKHEDTVEAFVRVPDDHAFTHAILVCTSPLWQSALARQVKRWLPAVHLLEVDIGEPYPAENQRTILLFATHEEVLPQPWQAVQHSYLDTLLLSSAGPMFPERRCSELYVTSLSASMFNLALAACGTQGEVLEQAVSASPVSRVVHRKTRVLIAEDDPLNRTLLEHQLVALGYDCFDSVADGSEALKFCLANTYDIVVTDLGMPLMDGRTFLKTLRKQGIQTPVIASTAESGGALLLEASGFAHVLLKPITIEQLQAALEHVQGAEQTPANNQPLTLQKDQLFTLFLAGWGNDEVALREACKRSDTTRFLSRLHRLKGALLVLGEKSIVERIDVLRLDVEGQGVELAHAHIDIFMDEMGALVNTFQPDKAL